MTSRTLSHSQDLLASTSKRGPGFHTISVASYSSSSSSSSDETVEVPADLNSLEFLLFAGFEHGVADEIWRAWNIQRACDDLPFESWVVDDALNYIEQKAQQQDAIEAGDDWDGALRHMGLSEDLRRRILNPTFDYIRLTECACYWALDTVREAFGYLNTLSKRIEKKQAQISRNNTPDESIRPRPAIRPQGRHARIGSSSRSSELPTPDIQTNTPPKQIEDHTMFFKDGTEWRLQRCMEKDGSVNLSGLKSQAPTDFHPTRGEYVYLTKHYDSALKYARYAENRNTACKAAVLHIAIPNELTANQREIYGEDWSDMIWFSRNEEATESMHNQLPPHLHKYQNAKLLVGQICGDATHKIDRMRDKSELRVMKLPNGGKASQLAIQDVDMQIEIETRCKGLVWVVIC